MRCMLKQCLLQCHKAKNLIPDAGSQPTRTGKAVLEIQVCVKHTINAWPYRNLAGKETFHLYISNLVSYCDIPDKLCLILWKCLWWYWVNHSYKNHALLNRVTFKEMPYLILSVKSQRLNWCQHKCSCFRNVSLHVKLGGFHSMRKYIFDQLLGALVQICLVRFFRTRQDFLLVVLVFLELGLSFNWIIRYMHADDVISIANCCALYKAWQFKTCVPSYCFNTLGINFQWSWMCITPTWVKHTINADVVIFKVATLLFKGCSLIEYPSMDLFFWVSRRTGHTLTFGTEWNSRSNFELGPSSLSCQRVKENLDSQFHTLSFLIHGPM